jgi:hypothetical protein
MLKRIALVIWWLGMISIGAGALGFFGCLVTTGSHAGENALMALVSGAFFGLCCWTLTFILAGSFLRPPAPQ